jgi:hypothetical protein
VVVALVPDLLRARQQGLDPLAQLHQRVAVVGLLDDPGDELADAVLVLLEHHPPLRLADPLEDHLLRGLRRDPPEVLRGHVAGPDLVHEGPRFELTRLASRRRRLRIDRRPVDLDLGIGSPAASAASAACHLGARRAGASRVLWTISSGRKSAVSDRPTLSAAPGVFL